MSILAPLNDHYHYWDRFYEAWRHNDINALKGMGWSEPNFDGSNNNKTIHYLPEPWWGYSGDTVGLNSVIVNFNPGPAGHDQERQKFHCRWPYSRYVREQVLDSDNGIQNPDILKTNKWHSEHRANRIREALESYVDQSKFNLKNHLSIELIPWHSRSSKDIVNYCAKNRTTIFEHSIKFAAEASKHIDNAILKNVVLMRMSSSFLKQILGGIGGLNYLLEEHAICSNNANQNTNATKHAISSTDNNACLEIKSIKDLSPIDSINAYYCIFEFLTIPGVKFVCIWGPKTRNKFPNKKCLTEIIKQIAIYKLTKS